VLHSIFTCRVVLHLHAQKEEEENDFSVIQRTSREPMKIKTYRVVETFQA